MATDPNHGVLGALGLKTGSDAAAKPEPENPTDPAPDLFADHDLLRPLDYEGPRRPGRPNGSRDKKTEEVVDFIRSQHRDPLIAMAQIVSTPLPELKNAFPGVAMEKLLEYHRKVMTTLAEYLHQKQPTAIQVKDESAGVLMIVTEAQASAIQQGANPFAPGFAPEPLTIENMQQDQEDSEIDPPTSHEPDVS